MTIRDELLEKWQQCRESRYPILVIIKAPLDALLTSTDIEEFADITKAKLLNYQKMYQGKLDQFSTWQTIREELYAAANTEPIVVTELEPIYAKWPVDERLAFLRNLLKSSPDHSLVLIINCQEDLSELRAVEENSRGMIWVPSK